MSSYDISELLDYRIFADAQNLKFHHNARIYRLVKKQDIERFQFYVDVNDTSNRSHGRGLIRNGNSYGRMLKGARYETKSNIQPMPSFMLKLMQEEAERLARNCSSGLQPDNEAQETLQYDLQPDPGPELINNDLSSHEHDVADEALSQYIKGDANIDVEELYSGSYAVQKSLNTNEHEQEEDSSLSSGVSILDLEAYLTVAKSPLFEPADMTMIFHDSTRSSGGLSVKPISDYTAVSLVQHTDECPSKNPIGRKNIPPTTTTTKTSDYKHDQVLDMEGLAGVEPETEFRVLAEDNQGCNTNSHAGSIRGYIQPAMKPECQHDKAHTESSDDSDTTISHLISPSKIRDVLVSTLRTTRSSPRSSAVSTQNPNSRSDCTNLTMTGSNIYGQSHSYTSTSRLETECSDHARNSPLIELDFYDTSEERNQSSLPEHDSGWGGHPAKRVAWNKTAPQLPQRRRHWQSTSILDKQEDDVTSRDTVWEDIRNDDEQRLTLVKEWLTALPLESICDFEQSITLETISGPAVSKLDAGMLDHGSSQHVNCEIPSTDTNSGSSGSKTRRASCAVLNCAQLARQTEEHITKKQCMTQSESESSADELR